MKALYLKGGAIFTFVERVRSDATPHLTVPKILPVLCVLAQDLAVITDADFQVLLDELLEYEAIGKLDAIVA